MNKLPRLEYTQLSLQTWLPFLLFSPARKEMWVCGNSKDNREAGPSAGMRAHEVFKHNDKVTQA